MLIMKIHRLNTSAPNHSIVPFGWHFGWNIERLEKCSGCDCCAPVGLSYVIDIIAIYLDKFVSTTGDEKETVWWDVHRIDAA